MSNQCSSEPTGMQTELRKNCKAGTFACGHALDREFAEDDEGTWEVFPGCLMLAFV